MNIQSTCANACTVCASDMTNSHSSLPSEQGKDTGVVLYIFHICVQFDVYVAKCFMLMYALCKNKKF